ncbi:hypothetical protein G7K_2268-t1 [Saitoella complicata NRRL Y-17804]|uniref:Uncharacterized protein n=1 Tax=Saitoella complicata (strain BCRC 22490 / CBS 7301 / JCM 7358 / NBRC 10748 / NRRL Y-17804) TaxID=698492 RepID=A0A0E9NEF9_SAICN|nr:hypothetical protein G7K_2268-t1 [Saitoella complicata NRRL Y-17804]
MMLVGIIPGPNEPSDLYSFLLPLVEEFEALYKGIPGIWDVSSVDSKHMTFTMRTYICAVARDRPAMKKMMQTVEPLRACLGILFLPTPQWPWNFGIDVMHLICDNKCHLLFNLWDGRLPCNTDATCTAADKPDAEELQVAVRPLDDSERERGRGRDPEEAEEDADAAVNSDDASRIDNL